MIAAPALAVATLMVGLRLGAKDAVRAASVIAAPPTERGAAWQILTYVDDRGVRETVAIPHLSVTARAGDDKATWTGASNADGVAEAILSLPNLNPTSDVEIEVREDGVPEPLAAGVVRVKDGPWGPARADVAARPTKKEGEIDLDVLVEGERLAPGFPTPVWVRVGGGPREGLVIEASPEPGARIERATVRPCKPGWAELVVTAEAHVTGITVRARAPSGAEGTWFGALPVAPGAFYASMPRQIAAGASAKVVLIAPNPRKVAYAEVASTKGRSHAAVVDIALERGDPTPRGTLELPPLAPGLYWLATSGDARGVEGMIGAAIAHPFVVGHPEGLEGDSACDVGSFLARHPGSRFTKWIAIDGLAWRRAGERSKRRTGLLLGVLALTLAALVEAILLGQGAREAKLRVSAALAASEDDGDDGAKARHDHTAAGGAAGNVLVSVLLACLGFALLAAFVATR